MNKWLLCALAGCLALSVSWGQGNQVGPDVLVLDLRKAVDDCDEHDDLVGGLKKEADKLEAKYAEAVRKLQAKQKELLKKTLSMRGADWYQEVEKSLRKEGEFKAIEAFAKVRFGDRISRSMEALMISAREAAHEIMKARKAKMVIISKLSPIKFETENDIKDELINRRVICVDKKGGADITKAVVELMNKKYKARKKARGKVEPNKKPNKTKPDNKE